MSYPKFVAWADLIYTCIRYLYESLHPCKRQIGSNHTFPILRLARLFNRFNSFQIRIEKATVGGIVTEVCDAINVLYLEKIPFRHPSKLKNGLISQICSTQDGTYRTTLEPSMVNVFVDRNSHFQGKRKHHCP